MPSALEVLNLEVAVVMDRLHRVWEMTGIHKEVSHLPHVDFLAGTLLESNLDDEFVNGVPPM